MTAKSISKNDEKNIIAAQGEVNITSGKTKLKADQIIYNIEKKEIIASGNVIIYDDNGNVFYASKAKLKDNLKMSLIKNIGILLSDNSRLASSSARSVEKQNKIIYNNVIFTKCKSCEEEKNNEVLWKLKAKKATHLKKSKIILYENVFLEVFKVPVLFVPIFYHPDPTVKSKTGFLAPKISNSSTFGTLFDLPLFLNISNTSNLTLNTKYSSKEGILLAKEYNKISNKSNLKLNASLTKGNKTRLNEPTKKEIRGHLDLKYIYEASRNLRIGSNIKKSSDKSYLTKYRLSDGETVLTQNIFSDYGSIYKNMSVDLFKFQSLSDEYKTSKLPFIRPLIKFNWNNLSNNNRKRNKLHKLTLTSVTRNNNQNVEALHFETKNERKYLYKGVLLKDINKINIDSYSRNGTTNNKSLLKLFPQKGFDVKYPLISERKNSSLLVEPVFQIFISPDDYKNYKIRNEDSLEVDLSSSNLFDINRYAGLDRIESGIRTNYGIIFKEVQSNGDIIGGSIGQSYNSNQQQLFNEMSGFKNNYSEFVGSLNLNKSKYDIKYDFRLSDKLKIKRNSVEGSTSFIKTNFNLSYIQLKAFASARHDDTEQINYRVSRNISNSWNISFSQVRDLAGAKYSSPLRTSFSLNFNNECALVQVGFARDKSYDIDIPAETNLSFNIKLFGF